MPLASCPRIAHHAPEAIIVSIYPDVCWTPFFGVMLPIPYHITADLWLSNSTSSNVRAGGTSVFTMVSHVSTVKGDEPGTGGGLFSGVNRGYCIPITPRSTVFANGSQVVAHSAFFKMNCNSPDENAAANTVGKLTYLDPVHGAWNSRPGWNVSPAFELAVMFLSEKLQTDPYYLMAIMDRETGGTFDATTVERGGGGGLGLIQFTDTALLDVFISSRGLANGTGHLRMMNLINSGISSPDYDSAELERLIEIERARFFDDDGSPIDDRCTDPTNDPLCLFRADYQAGTINEALAEQLISVFDHAIVATGNIEQFLYVDLYYERRLQYPLDISPPLSFEDLVTLTNPGSGVPPYLERLRNQINAERTALGLQPLSDTLTADQLMEQSQLDLLDMGNMQHCTGANIPNSGGP